MLKRIQVTLRSKDDGTTGLTGMKRVPEVCQMKQMQRKCNAHKGQTWPNTPDYQNIGQSQLDFLNYTNINPDLQLNINPDAD
jgi:hypothetical protein